MVNADIHSALSKVATELKPVLLQLHHPAALQAYDNLFEVIFSFARWLYYVIKRSDTGNPSQQLLGRFWAASEQHKTPMALMDLVSARQLPDVNVTAEDFSIIIIAHTSASEAGKYGLPEWSNALEALYRSHAAQQFVVQMLQGVLKAGHKSLFSIENCRIRLKYLSEVYKGVLIYCIHITNACLCNCL